MKYYKFQRQFWSLSVGLKDHIQFLLFFHTRKFFIEEQGVVSNNNVQIQQAWSQEKVDPSINRVA